MCAAEPPEVAQHPESSVTSEGYISDAAVCAIEVLPAYLPLMCCRALHADSCLAARLTATVGKDSLRVPSYDFLFLLSAESMHVDVVGSRLDHQLRRRFHVLCTGRAYVTGCRGCTHRVSGAVWGGAGRPGRGPEHQGSEALRCQLAGADARELACVATAIRTSPSNVRTRGAALGQLQ